MENLIVREIVVIDISEEEAMWYFLLRSLAKNSREESTNSREFMRAHDGSEMSEMRGIFRLVHTCELVVHKDN